MSSKECQNTQRKKLPDENEEGQEDEKVVGLIVEQVVGDAVVDPRQVFEVGYGVVFRLADEVLVGTKRRKLHLI